MRIVDAIDDILFGFCKDTFDIVFDFLDDCTACLVVHNPKYMSEETEITQKVVDVFTNKGYAVEYEWDYDAGDEYSRTCDLDIKVVGYIG